MVRGRKRKKSNSSTSSDPRAQKEEEPDSTPTTGTTALGNSSINRKKKRSTDDTMWGSGIHSGVTGTSSSSWGGGRNKSAQSRSSAADSNRVTTAATKLFDVYCDPDDNTVMNMEGIEIFCEHLGIDPMKDIRILVLLWKLHATEKPGHITKDEWVKGCEALGIDSVEKIKKKILPILDPGFIEQDDFKEFYKWVFQFNREGTHRTLDKGLVIALQELVLKDRVDEKRLTSWTRFLEELTGDNYSRITLDQWISFLDFCFECQDLDVDYDDENSAWPVLIDEYVDYTKKQNCGN